ncbi:MAG: leucine-rich repeat protein [Treponema sp.]|nr:leucine-rich repeat protein [Treponema sp.]
MKKDTKQKRILILAACAITLVCFGCKNEEEDEPAPTPIVVESVTIDKTTLTLTLGETIKLTATIKPENADDKTVKWSSSNKTIATVDNDGTVTTVKVGSATITAQSGDKEAKCAITVHEHSYSDGKCTVCGTVLSWKYGTINEKGILTKYSGYEATVEIPEGVISIGNKAFFEKIYNLEEVKIPASVTSIGDSAFENCTKLAVVTIPASVTSIGSNAFKGCKNLSEIQFEGTKEQWNAIEGSDKTGIPGIRCSDGNIGVLGVPSYLKVSGTIVTGRTSVVPKNIVIPDGITEIGSMLFIYSGVETITIPASVTSIGKDAFYWTGGLTKVTYTGTLADWCAIDWESYAANPLYNGNAMLYINDSAVTDAKIPNSITEIKDDAFYGYKSLTSVTIPVSVTSIGRNAFYGCENLSKIEFEGTKEQWNAIEGSDKTGIPGIRCSDGVIGVLGVPSYLKVSGTTVTRYTSKIPANLVIPDGVTGIGSSALSSCTNLERVTIPGSVTYIGEDAFRMCYSLTSVTMDDGTTSIGESAFSSCTNLASVTIPASVTSIGRNAFYGCTNLAEIQFNGTKEQWNNIEGSSNIGIPGIRCSDGVIGVLGVPSYLRISGTKVSGYTDAIPSNVVIPDGVTEIGSTAFNRCKNLESVTIPASVKSIDKGDSFSGAFFSCTKLKTVTMSNGMENIGEYAFFGCTSLTSVTIPSSVTSIGNESFDKCTNLMNVIYTGTLADWCAIDWKNYAANPLYNGNAMLYINNSAVKDVKIPNNVTEIKKHAFYGYKNLTSVTIPVSVTSIGSNAFAGCTGLTKVTYTGTLTDWCAIDWENSLANPLHNEKAILYINGLAVTDVVIPNSVTEIKKLAFYWYNNLTSVTIPNNVKSIGKAAFSECTNLTSVMIDDGATSIGDSAFFSCKNLTRVTIPSSVESIGENAFYSCTNLASIHYDGTKTEWEKIKRDTDGLSGKTITGKDGTWTAQ